MMIKAMLRSWNRDVSYEDEEIEVDERYDVVKGPHHEDNEDYCPVIGSNQDIVIEE